MTEDDWKTWFVRGETPLGWLDYAGRLGTDEFAVALFAWIGHGLEGDRPATFPASLLARRGLGASEVDRAIRSLEAAALVRVSRTPGAPVQLTVLPVPSGPSTPRQRSD